MVPDQESKSTGPPLTWVFLITLFRLQCNPVPCLGVYRFSSLFLIRRPCSLKPRSSDDMAPFILFPCLHPETRVCLSLAFEAQPPHLPDPASSGYLSRSCLSLSFLISAYKCVQIVLPPRVSPILPALPSHHSFSQITLFLVTHKSLPSSPTTSVPRKTLILKLTSGSRPLRQPLLTFSFSLILKM